mmetsp:Transcript_4905/g.12443  ORF Transcript_4905/g.12443 Transcript_4905/m.12443 type:complete len:250 (-) Transcript_4905:180-929(-)
MLPSLLTQAQLARPGLRRWVAHHVYGPHPANPQGVEGGAPGGGGGEETELVGTDSLIWDAQLGGALVVLQLRGVRDQIRWCVNVNLGGVLRRVPAESGQVAITSVDTLTNWLETLGGMKLCSGVQGPDGIRQVADDVGSQFGRGRFSAESARLMGARGDVDWTIRSLDCALLVNGSDFCDGCGALKGNLRARLSDHKGGRLALKLKPDSKVDVTLMGPGVLRQRLAQETRLRRNSEEREEALKLKIFQM